MRKVLTQKFFNRPALKVAEEMLGKYIVRKIGKKEIALMITETEGYDGFLDKASHAHRGKTERNKIMFGEAGRWYVYFTYGMHWMLNLVVGKKDYPAAVLIRGGVEVAGPARTPIFPSQKVNDSTVRRREINIQDILGKDNKVFARGTMANLVSGPARLTKFLKIDKKLNNKTVSKKTGLWIEDRGVQISKKEIIRTARVGVRYSEEWADKPYRFVLGNRK